MSIAEIIRSKTVLSQVTRTITSSCILPLGPDCDIPYFCLAAACCTKWSISPFCHRLNDQYSLTSSHTLLIFVALLTLRVRARLRGLLVRFSACLPTRYQLIPTEKILCIYIQWQLWQEICELCSLEPLNRTILAYLSHWLACISYLFWTGQQGAGNMLQLKIKCCNIWESPCQN